MTNASSEVSEIDVSARGSISLLLASSLLWLLVSGGLMLINFVQTLSPGFLAHCPVLTYGQTRALQETAFVYGWVANAGFAVALWVLARLGGSPLRSLNWAIAGTVSWNLGLTLGLVGIALGDGSSIPFLHLPAYVQPFLLFSFGAIAVPGVLAWTGRNRETTFAAQWYAVAALFLFPWLFSAAQVTLVWFPVRGTLQAVAAGWFLQGAWTLWIAPIALAAAYYLVPKISGRVIPNYDFASLSFWTLLVVGGWTGGRHLIGGPVPAWIATISIVSCAMLVFHYVVTALNLRRAFGAGSTSLKFIALGVAAYVIGGFADAATSLRSVAQVVQFTWFTQAQSQLALTGAFSLIVFGAIYFLVPRLFNQAWPSAGLIRMHFWMATIGTIGLVAGLVIAGLVQGGDLASASTSFTDISAHTRPWILVATVSEALLILGNVLLALNFARLVVSKPAAAAPSLFRQPAAMEASVS
jgi:cytochrome c oxidase cbb3-type subunit 1